MSCSNNSFSTGHKCCSSKVNIRLSIDGFHDRERFYRRRTRTCRLLPVFSVFNGPSVRPDLRRSSFPCAAKTTVSHGKDKREPWLYEHFARLSLYTFDARFERRKNRRAITRVSGYECVVVLIVSRI